VKHRVKVQYVVDIEADTQQSAVSIASYNIPSTTTNVNMECWTPKQKTAEPAPIIAEPGHVTPEAVPVPAIADDDRPF
jgi:hypothetical protein